MDPKAAKSSGPRRTGAGSYSAEVIRLARECGYDAAFAVDQRETSHKEPLCAMPRFDTGRFSAERMRWKVGGTIEGLRRVRANLRRARVGHRVESVQ